MSQCSFTRGYCVRRYRGPWPTSLAALLANPLSYTCAIYKSGPLKPANYGILVIMSSILCLSLFLLISVVVSSPGGWAGNFYAVRDMLDGKVGILGEIRWNSFANLTFFDVSAVINPNDQSNVKFMFPKNA
jgi:hypothetical protein